MHSLAFRIFQEIKWKLLLSDMAKMLASHFIITKIIHSNQFTTNPMETWSASKILLKMMKRYENCKAWWFYGRLNITSFQCIPVLKFFCTNLNATVTKTSVNYDYLNTRFDDCRKKFWLIHKLLYVTTKRFELKKKNTPDVQGLSHVTAF